MNRHWLISGRRLLEKRYLEHGTTCIKPHTWTLSKEERHRKMHDEINAIRMQKARFQATPEIKEKGAMRKRKAMDEENLESKNMRQCVDKESR